MNSYRAAFAAFREASPAGDWRDLDVFHPGEAAERACLAADAEVAAGHVVAPEPARVFTALSQTPLSRVRVLILGQDPYPTPGHANGLAFSYAGPLPLPRSLTNIFRERQADVGTAPPSDGNLAYWASQGVLMLNAALTVRVGAGRAGSHLSLGWLAVTEAVVTAVSRERANAVFLLWGAPAQSRRALIDESRHLVIASAHPSPLSAQRGFFGSRPFSRANEWLVERGGEPVRW